MDFATQALEFTFPEDEDENLKLPYIKIFPQGDDITEELLFSLHQGENVIGRNETCDIFINNQSLSKEHAVIEVERNDYLIYDKGSLNKTRKNKLVLKPSVRYNLAAGDDLFFGNLHCQFVVEEKIENTSFQNHEPQNAPALLSDTDDENEIQDTRELPPPCQNDISEKPASQLVLPKSLTQDDDDDTDMEEMDIDLMAPTQPFIGDAEAVKLMDSGEMMGENLKDIFEANTEPIQPLEIKEEIKEKSSPLEGVNALLEMNSFDQSTFLPNTSTEDILCPSTQVLGEPSPQPSTSKQDDYIAETPPHLIDDSDIISSPSQSPKHTPKVAQKLSTTTFLDPSGAFETSDLPTVLEKEEPKHSDSALSDNLILKLSSSDLDGVPSTLPHDNIVDDVHKNDKEIDAEPSSILDSDHICNSPKHGMTTHSETLTSISKEETNFNTCLKKSLNEELDSKNESSKDPLQSNFTTELNNSELCTNNTPLLASNSILKQKTTVSSIKLENNINSSNNLSSPTFSNQEEKVLNVSDEDSFKLPPSKIFSLKPCASPKKPKVLELVAHSLEDDDLPPTQPLVNVSCANHSNSTLKTATSILEEMAEVDTEDLAPTQQLILPPSMEDASSNKKLQIVEDSEDVLESTQLYVEPNFPLSHDQNLSLPKASASSQENESKVNVDHVEVLAPSSTSYSSLSKSISNKLTVDNDVLNLSSCVLANENHNFDDKSYVTKNYEKNIPFIKASSDHEVLLPSTDVKTLISQSEKDKFHNESEKASVKIDIKKGKSASAKTKGKAKTQCTSQNEPETNKSANAIKPANALQEETSKMSRRKKTSAKGKSDEKSDNSHNYETVDKKNVKNIEPIDNKVKESLRGDILGKGNKEFDFKVPDIKPRGRRGKGSSSQKKSTLDVQHDTPNDLKLAAKVATLASNDKHATKDETGISLEMATGKTNTKSKITVESSFGEELQVKVEVGRRHKMTRNAVKEEAQNSKALNTNSPPKITKNKAFNKQSMQKNDASKVNENQKDIDSQESAETLSQIVRFIDGFVSQETDSSSKHEETINANHTTQPSAKLRPSKQHIQTKNEVQNSGNNTNKPSAKLKSSKQHFETMKEVQNENIIKGSKHNPTKQEFPDKNEPVKVKSSKINSSTKRKSLEKEDEEESSSKNFRKKSKSEVVQESAKSKSPTVRRSSRKLALSNEQKKPSELKSECKSTINLRAKSLKVKLNTTSTRDSKAHSAPASSVPSQEETLSQIVAFVNEPQSQFAGDMSTVTASESLASKSEDTPETLSQICHFINLTDQEVNKDSNKSIISKSLIKTSQNESSAYIEVIKLDVPKESDSTTTNLIGTRSKTSLKSNDSIKTSKNKRKNTSKDLLMEKVSDDHYLIKTNSTCSKSLASIESKTEDSKDVIQGKENAGKKCTRAALKKKNEAVKNISADSLQDNNSKKDILEKVDKAELKKTNSNDSDFILEKRQTRKRKSETSPAPSPKGSPATRSKNTKNKNLGSSPSLKSKSTKEILTSKKESPQMTPRSSPRIAASPHRGKLQTRANNSFNEAKDTLDHLNAHLLPSIEDQNSDDRSQTSSGSNPALLSRREHAKPKVMFTGILGDESKQKMVLDLNGEIASSSLECTHLITDKFRRTIKTLACIAKGTPIVTLAWLRESSVLKKFLDYQMYLLSDPTAEEHFKFCLALTLNSARHAPLLAGWSLHVTPHVVPSPEQLKEVIVCGKGKFLDKMPTKNATGTVVISCPEDKQLCQPARRVGIPIVTAEFLLTGLLQYELNVEKYAM